MLVRAWRSCTALRSHRMSLRGHSAERLVTQDPLARGKIVKKRLQGPSQSLITCFFASRITSSSLSPCGGPPGPQTYSAKLRPVRWGAPPRSKPTPVVLPPPPEVGAVRFSTREPSRLSRRLDVACSWRRCPSFTCNCRPTLRVTLAVFPPSSESDASSLAAEPRSCTTAAIEGKPWAERQISSMWHSFLAHKQIKRLCKSAPTRRRCEALPTDWAR
mmetsp:Transcript_85257/g.182716  ORF Transcript_85257/g.182716 Transcript_85257/m.182716 type:complete len:217 (+) Transcript_85257:2338-2988(+)